MAPDLARLRGARPRARLRGVYRPILARHIATCHLRIAGGEQIEAAFAGGFLLFIGVRRLPMTPWGRLLLPEEMRKRANMSATTEWRLAKTGKGPPRIRISPQRYGYPEALFNKWLENRFERPIEAAR
jgi:predicted DNA-binding transcriptional regulator AlpA